MSLTNKAGCFQRTKVTEAGVSDFHRLIITFLRSQFCRLKPKKSAIETLKVESFNEQKLFEEVKNTGFMFNSDNSNENYEQINDVFSNIVEEKETRHPL